MRRIMRQFQSKASNVRLRQEALNRLKVLNHSRQNEFALRLKVESGGCSGFQYILNLVPRDSISSDDKVIEQDGCTVLVDNASLPFVSSCEIDFVEDLARAAFQVVKNDVASAKCGCGASFNIGFYKLLIYFIRLVCFGRPCSIWLRVSSAGIQRVSISRFNCSLLVSYRSRR